MRADFRFLAVEDVERIHGDQLARHGGSEHPGHRGAEGVAAAVAAVANSYYQDVFELGAAYAVYLVMGHVFGDGNKRTGCAAMLTFLRLHDVRIAVEPAELRDLMLELQARAETTPRPMASDLVAWIAAWLLARRRR